MVADPCILVTQNTWDGEKYVIIAASCNVAINFAVRELSNVKVDSYFTVVDDVTYISVTIATLSCFPVE